MTIRYSCTKCGAVMKIKDDKAGSSAKCPKCGTAFVVPALEEAWDGEIEFEKPAAEAAEPPDEDDVPLERAAPSERVTSSRKRKKIAEARADEDDDEEEQSSVDDESDDEEIDSDVEASDDDEEIDEDDDEENEEDDLGEDDDGDERISLQDDDSESPDMPLELTPAAPVSDAFDPSDVLGNSGSGRGMSAAAAAERKASVADMMREFEATKRKDKKSSESVPRPVVSTAQTAGTAAEAISRAYQAKRENIMNPKMKEPEVNEQRELFIAWAIRTIPVILFAIALGIGLYSFVNRRVYTGAPLAPVAGQLTRSGEPLSGYQVRLVPVLSDAELSDSGEKDSPPGRSTASGLTDGEGKFVIMYTIQDFGASIGDHKLELLNPDGLGVVVPEQYVNQTVPPEGIESLRIDLP